MEKVKFGTGGQPVALEDLELLQDNAQMLGLLVLESLIDGKAQQFLMRKITTTYQVLESDRVKVALSGGVLVANGELYHFAPADLTLANLSAPVYLCLQRTEADTRRFENNENKSCRVKYSAMLSATPVGECYKLSELKTVAELLREALRLGNGYASALENVEVDFKNGFKGSVTLSGSESNIVLNIVVSSEQSTWSSSDFGVIFKIKDSTLAAKFMNKNGGVFVISGTKQNPDASPIRCIVRYEDDGAKLLSVLSGGQLAVGYVPPCVTINSTITIPN